MQEWEWLSMLPGHLLKHIMLPFLLDCSCLCWAKFQVGNRAQATSSLFLNSEVFLAVSIPYPLGFQLWGESQEICLNHEHFFPLAIPSRLPLLSCNDFFLRHVRATWWPKATDNLSFCLTSARVRCLFLNNASQNGEVVSDWLLLLTCPFLNQSLWLRNYGTLVGLIHGPTPVVWELRPGNGWLHLEKQG